MKDSEIYRELAHLIRKQLDPDDIDDEVRKAIGKKKSLNLTVLLPLTVPPEMEDGVIWNSYCQLSIELDRIAGGSSTDHNLLHGTWKGESERCCLPTSTVSMQDWEKLVELLPEALKQLQKNLLQETIAFIISKPGEKRLTTHERFLFDAQESDWHEMRDKKWRYHTERIEDSIILSRLRIASQDENAPPKSDGPTFTADQVKFLMDNANNESPHDSQATREELATARDRHREAQHEAEELKAELDDLRRQAPSDVTQVAVGDGNIQATGDLSIQNHTMLSCSELSNLLDQASRCQVLEKRLDALNSIKKLLDESSDDSLLCLALRARCNAELMDSWGAIRDLGGLGVSP